MNSTGSPRRVATRVAAVAATLLATASAGVLTATAASAGSCPSAPGKCFAVNISPSTYESGSTLNFTAVVTNEATGQYLGAVNLDAPAGYTITHVGAPSTGTSAQSGNEAQLRNLSLVPGGVVSVVITVKTASLDGSYTWFTTAKQSNDYNGTGNDFVLDPSSALTTTGTSTNPGVACGPQDVSCGKNFITYNRASTVSTGSTVNSSVWLVGSMAFPATSVSGGQFYGMEALATPHADCPTAGGLSCQFEMKTDDIPAPYDAAHPGTLTMLCDPSHCTGSQLLLFKVTASGSTPVLPCALAVLGGLCVDDTVGSNGVHTITVRNITTGDPSWAGITLF